MTTGQALYDIGAFLRVPERFNIAHHTLAHAETSPDKLALEVITAPGRIAEAWRFADLGAAVRGTMTGLARAGVTPGDRVLLRLGNSVDFPLAFFAAAGMGALPVPSSAQWTQREVDIAARMIRPALVLADGSGPVPEGARPIGPETYRPWRELPPADYADTAADDPAYILFTSGTGGQPKGVLHAHRAAWARRMMWRDWYELHADDRLLHAGAFNWSYTLGTGITDPWAAGATGLIYAGPPDRGVWSALIARHQATIFAAAPGVFRQLLSSGGAEAADFASLRHALTAGDHMADSLRAEWQALTGRPVYEALGMTEVSTYASQSPERPRLTPQRGRRVAVLSDAGEIAAPDEMGQLAVSSRDPGLMLGYWQGENAPPELPLAGEWFLTGDMAVMDETGALAHKGRADDVMNAQGYRVSAAEIEAVLMAHPGVAEAAALPLPVRADVEVIAACVVPAPHADITEEILAEHCKSQLAAYKRPRLYHILPALPRTTTGKVLKRQLRQELGKEAAS